MADITRWDPFAEMASIRQTMDRLFEEAWPRRFGLNSEAYFPVDLYETNDEVVVKASLPGVKPEDIDISVTGQTVTIKAESADEHEEKAPNYYRRERRTGSFMRQLQLPSEVDSAKAAASFEHGVLKLTLPKAEAVKPKTIKVQAKPLIEGKNS
jgi:HSP20 family protein